MAPAMSGGRLGSKNGCLQQMHLFLLPLIGGWVQGPFGCSWLRGTQVLW